MKSIITYLAWLVVPLILVASPRAARANDYQRDDGTAEDAIGLSSGGDLIAINHFTVSGGNNMIMSISIAWGTPNFPDLSLNGLTYRAVLWNDPLGTGDPNNAVLAAPTLNGVISSAGTNTFLTSTFQSCVTVTNSFFVGFILTQNAGQFPAAIDFDAPTYSNESFLAASFTPGAGNIVNLANNDFPVGSVESYGFAGNWLIRADACAPVPEPTTASLVIVAGAIALLSLTKKQRKSARTL